MSLPQASVQLYSLVGQFSDDPHGSLEKLAGIGLRSIEAFAFFDQPREIRQALDASGLSAPTGHASLLSDALWTPDGSLPAPHPEAVFEAAATIGIQTVIDPYVEPERWLTEDGVKDIAERMNHAVELAATFGLSVGYHNHAHEFVADFDGVTAYERFVSLTDDRVALELDLYWALTGTRDVTGLVSRLGQRLIAVHVKDGIVPPTNPWARGSSGPRSQTLDQRHAGSGEVPLADCLRAGTSILYAIIEYDHAPGDVFEDIASSYAFLRDGGFVA